MSLRLWKECILPKRKDGPIGRRPIRLVESVRRKTSIRPTELDFFSFFFELEPWAVKLDFSDEVDSMNEMKMFSSWWLQIKFQTKS